MSDPILVLLLRCSAVFLIFWSICGIASEVLWSMYWATLRDVYPSLPKITRTQFLKNLIMVIIGGAFAAIANYIAIRDVRALVRRDSDDNGGRLVYRELMPDPPPAPKNTKPALR